MASEFYLALAGAIIWAGYGLYLAFLALTQKNLIRNVERLEKLTHEK